MLAIAVLSRWIYSEILGMNVIEILHRFGVEFAYAGDELQTLCPFHNDSSPSCFINAEKLVFNCRTSGCGAKGNIVGFLSRFSGKSIDDTKQFLASEFGYEPDEKIVQPEVVERYFSALKNAKPLLHELYKRGINDELIRQYRLGEHNGRITIPIKSHSGNWVHVKEYAPGQKSKKYKNQKGRGKNRLFPIDQLKYDKILYTGGELKAVLAASILNAAGIGAISCTSGEDNHDPKVLAALRGKTVYVCMDVDEAGQQGAIRACRVLHRIAGWVGNIQLPLDPSRYPTGDINDFVVNEHGDLLQQVEQCLQWIAPKSESTYEPPVDITLREAVHADNADRRIRLKAFVSAVDQTTYAIPKTVAVDCGRDQGECQLCPIYLAKNGELSHVPSESGAILAMVNSRKDAQRAAIMEALDIPRNCKSCQFNAREYYNVEDVRISAQIEITNRAADTALQPAICIGEGLEPNESYEMVGRMLPHPHTQQSTLLISEYQGTEDALSSYVPEHLEDLKVFRPVSNDTKNVRAKLHEIYRDLEGNITRVFSRREIHLAIDFAYHSPLFFNYNGKLTKGWVEVLILGDSSQGKSEVFKHLANHYGLGEKVECKNASVAGLLGGLQQHGNRWFVSWGVVPTHDKRLVCFEEVKGMSTEVIGRLTDMRSSGIAELPKIEKRRTHARTRGVWISNPRDDRSLSQHNFGVEAVKQLIGSLEDVRRFDFCLLVGSSEVTSEEISQQEELKPPLHVFTNDLCRRLILWAWTRDESQVVFEDEKYIREKTDELCQRYTDAIPIVDRGSMRLKLARLSAAIAARLFSTLDDDNPNSMHTLYVRNCHVDFVCETLIKCYDKKTCGYRDYTQALQLKDTIASPKDIKIAIANAPYAEELIDSLLHTKEITLQDFCDWCDYTRDEAQQLLSILVRKHALVRERRFYRKTAAFIELLKELQNSDEIKSLDNRPDFIKEEF